MSIFVIVSKYYSYSRRVKGYLTVTSMNLSAQSPVTLDSNGYQIPHDLSNKMLCLQDDSKNNVKFHVQGPCSANCNRMHTVSLLKDRKGFKQAKNCDVNGTLCHKNFPYPIMSNIFPIPPPAHCQATSAHCGCTNQSIFSNLQNNSIHSKMDAMCQKVSVNSVKKHHSTEHILQVSHDAHESTSQRKSSYDLSNHVNNACFGIPDVYSNLDKNKYSPQFSNVDIIIPNPSNHIRLNKRNREISNSIIRRNTDIHENREQFNEVIDNSSYQNETDFSYTEQQAFALSTVSGVQVTCDTNTQNACIENAGSYKTMLLQSQKLNGCNRGKTNRVEERILHQFFYGNIRKDVPEMLDDNSKIDVAIKPSDEKSFLAIRQITVDNMDKKACMHIKNRKQMYPKKFIRLESYIPEETDPAFLLSSEFLDQVTGTTDISCLSHHIKNLPSVPFHKNSNSNIVAWKNNAFKSSTSINDDTALNTNSNNTFASDCPTNNIAGISNRVVSVPLKSILCMSASEMVEECRHQQVEQCAESATNRLYPPRKVQKKDCSKCRYNCSVNITQDQRQAIFDHFWSLRSSLKRLYFFCQSIKEKPAKTTKHTRECSREYMFRVDGSHVRVCKGFYLATLNVSDKAVRIAMEKRKRGRGVCDRRSNLPPVNGKMRSEEHEKARNHIESYLLPEIFNKTRENSSVVPGEDFDLSSKYLEYAEKCSSENRVGISEEEYKMMFTTEYNLRLVDA